MKAKNLFIFIAFLFFVKVSNAQSFLTQDKVWSDYYYTDYYLLYAEDGRFLGWTAAEISTWYKVGTDSLIEGKHYKQILSSEDSTMENWHLKALMREDGDKVFLSYPMSKTEFLLYDFGMQPGDTLFDADGYVATILETVRDTVMDKTRKLFIFSKYMYDSSLQGYNDSYKGEETWIEGIGALRGGLFRPLSDFSTSGNIDYDGLICYFENGELVFHDPSFEECYYHKLECENQFNSIREIKANSLTVYPNPVDNLLIISPSGKTISKVEFFDSSGKLVYSKQNESTIDVSFFPKGLYFLKVYDTTGKVSLFKIIKR